MNVLSKSLIVTLFLFPTCGFSENGRTPHGVETIEETRLDITSWKGQYVGLHGKIIDIKYEERKRMVFLLEVRNEDKNDRVWVASIFKNLNVSDEISVLGIMTHINSKLKVVPQLTNDKFMLLGRCIINYTQKTAGGASKNDKYCSQWFKEGFPTAPSNQ